MRILRSVFIISGRSFLYDKNSRKNAAGRGLVYSYTYILTVPAAVYSLFFVLVFILSAVHPRKRLILLNIDLFVLLLFHAPLPVSAERGREIHTRFISKAQ